jgi:hypothetical protein
MVISIYPIIRGEHREMKAEANMTAAGPFDSPDAIAGRLIELPSPEEVGEIRVNEVLLDGEVYAFDSLADDGVFELRKAW